MVELPKRGPGRPRKSETRVHVDITLTRETVDYLNAQPESRSAFIERLIAEHRQRTEH